MLFLNADAILQHVAIHAAGALVRSRACLAPRSAGHAFVVDQVCAITAVALRSGRVEGEGLRAFCTGLGVDAEEAVRNHCTG